MKFRYKKYAPNVFRPVIPIEIIYKDKTVAYEVLVDSGADCNIFDAQIADILEIKLSSGKKREVAGITGTAETFYLHKLHLKVGGHLIKNVEVGFLKQMGEYSYGIVGQKGFFDIFIVKFDLIKKKIELKKRN